MISTDKLLLYIRKTVQSIALFDHNTELINETYFVLKILIPCNLGWRSDTNSFSKIPSIINK